LNKETNMPFVNEKISDEDRQRYDLDAFEGRFRSPIPSPDWAIDRERDIFLRTIYNETRKKEPGDREARYEKDFQFHWKGYEYLVATRRISAKDLEAWPGELFQSDNVYEDGARVLRFYLRHIGEVIKPRADAPSALRTHRQQILNDLEAALAFGSGGTFARLTPEEAAQPRRAVIRIAPHAEVVR
jgi:hypothetical protein